MSVTDFNLAMAYLDEIESALNQIARTLGHPVMDEFFAPEK